MNLDLTMLNSVSAHYGPTSIRVGQFFLSYNSVMTLAYEAFSRVLLSVKTHVESEMQGRLRAENPSSKWPKTTLACLVEDKPLSDQQVKGLRDTCTRSTSQLRSLSEDDARVFIEELKVVVFQCRTLERRLLSIPIRLNGAVSADDTPPEEHRTFVKTVMAQFDQSRHSEYYPDLLPKGRTLKGYYRQHHVEATLIADVSFSEKLRGIADGFREEINRRLPGCYEWFDPTSWHLTLRALVAE